MFKQKPRNYDEARQWMVERQLIERGISNKRVLTAMRTIPRHLFVDEAYQPQAYEDKPLPIGYEQTISQPYIVAHMAELLALPPHGEARVLDIGTGSGYQAAVLSHFVREVFTVERIPALAERAEQLFRRLQLNNIRVKLTDGGYGWADHAPYQAILSAAAAPTVPPPLIDQLADGGILVAPIGPRHQQYLVRLRRQGAHLDRENLTRVTFVPFRGEHGWQD